MLSAKRILCGMLLCSLIALTGCSTFSALSHKKDDDEFKGPKKWSEEWYAMYSDQTVGRRQKFKKGKVWPPQPRPIGEELPFWHKFHAAHYWPHPYSGQDENFINALQEQQVSNGWVNATTLYDYHFEPETQVLNHSGQMRLRWIIESAPEHRRVAFTQTGFNKEISNVRLQNVQLAAVEMVGEENIPPIMLRVTSPVGRPAAEIDFINRRLSRNHARSTYLIRIWFLCGKCKRRCRRIKSEVSNGHVISKHFLNICETLYRKCDIFTRMGSGDLCADACFSLRDNRIREPDYINALL